MSASFNDRYFTALEHTRSLLADFGTRFQPVSMATSAETGAFLCALREVMAPPCCIETGSGFSSALLPGALHVENNAAYERRVRQWLALLRVDGGSFCGYEQLYETPVDGRFLLFLDGDLATRERSAAWLADKLPRAVVLVDDAQAGTFVQVQAVLDALKADPRGQLLDCAAWTRDGYGRSAALWVGEASGMPAEVLRQITAGPQGAADLPVRLLLCVNDTVENGRWECTARTLTSLGITADLRAHPLWIVDNGSSCANTARFLPTWCRDQRVQGAEVRLFRLPRNRYASYAFNRLLAMVPAGEFVVRLENDIEFHTPGWPLRLARFLEASGFGLASPKPVDLPAKALGVPVREVAGLRVHEVDELPGYCIAIAPALRLALGAFASSGAYVEDVLTSCRARALGWRLAMLAPEELRCFHVDRVASPGYQEWKNRAVAQERALLASDLAQWGSGARPAFVPFAFDEADGFAEIAL